MTGNRGATRIRCWPRTQRTGILSREENQPAERAWPYLLCLGSHPLSRVTRLLAPVFVNAVLQCPGLWPLPPFTTLTLYAHSAAICRLRCVSGRTIIYDVATLLFRA